MPIPTDPFLAQQWHLGNTGGLLDLNVRAVWNPTQGPAYTGAGTWVLVIDDGFDYNHADLAAPHDENLDFDFDANNNGSNGEHDFDSFGQNDDNHGTAVMGIIGADNNGTGAVGVAFDSNLVGYRIHEFITDGWLQDIRDSIHFGALNAQADVANISQGIANDEDSEFGVGYNAVRFDEIETSIGTAVAQGRGGFGMTIVKSAGNSRADNYDVNADDWTNDTRQVVVAAVDQNGFVSNYSSYGSALLVSAFGTNNQVVTTDRTGAAGYNNTDFTFFDGTSAAAPMVSGVVSLMYDANASLGWRDVQSILANSARHVGSAVGAAPADDERYSWGWNQADTWNGGGLHFSNDYGYGLVDALAAVRLAETWLLTRPAQTNTNQFTNTMDVLNAATVIPVGATGLSFTAIASFADEVERVTVQMTFSTTFTGDLEVYLTSPDGTVSTLIHDTGGTNDFNGTWTFETQAFRGERADGNWTVRVVDDASGDTLTVSDIVIRTFGASTSNDRYVYTNEFSNYAGIGGHSTVLSDTNGGIDIINASAVTVASNIDLTAGFSSVIDGTLMSIAAGTQIENAIGGDGNDFLWGNGVGNLLYGMRGNDNIDGRLGADTMVGGFGNDNYVVDNAGDVVTENFLEGLDTVEAHLNHTLAVNVENLILQGGTNGTGNGSGNRIDGNGNNNILSGLGGVDFLFGHDGEDILDGGILGDTMVGGLGHDRYRVDSIFDVVTENAGEGRDVVEAFLNHALGLNVEDLVLQGGTTGTGNTEHNRIDGNGNNNFLNGLNGDDVLLGHDGEDRLDGGNGADEMRGGHGFDRYVVDHASDVAFEEGGQGLDIVEAYLNYTIALNVENAVLQGGTTVIGNTERNRIDGNGANNTLSGLTEDDFLLGYDGEDILDGGLNADTMLGGLGNDRYILDNGGDVVLEFAVEGLDTIEAFLDHTIEDNVENMILQGGITGTGNAENNRIDGNGANNFLSGLDGNDVLAGFGGEDTLTGGDEDDRFVLTQDGGDDTITDMLGGISAGDVMDIRAFGFVSFAAVMAATSDVSGGALIQLDADDTVFVQNLTKAQFDSNDFLLA